MHVLIIFKNNEKTKQAQKYVLFTRSKLNIKENMISKTITDLSREIIYQQKSYKYQQLG